MAFPSRLGQRSPASWVWLVWGTAAAVVLGTADFGAEAILLQVNFPTFLVALIAGQ